MPLTAQQRVEARNDWVANRAVDPSAAPCRFTKAEIEAALTAAVTWIEANQASFVSGLAGTAFAGAGSTADEKRRLFQAAFGRVYGMRF